MTAGRLLLLVPIAYLSVFFLYPLVAILTRSLGSEAGYNLGSFGFLLGDSYYLGRIWFTIWQAVVSTLLTLAVGLPAAYLFARYEFRGKTLLKAVTTLPFVMPTIVVALGFVTLFGTQGLVNTALMDLFGLDDPPVRIANSLTIIFMAHAFYNYAIVVRIVSALWANLDPNLEQSAKVLGAGRVSTFYHVTLPLLLPAIVSSSLLAFAFSFTSFGVVLILGGPQYATLEVAIYELTAKLFRLPLAGALAMIQLVFTYIFLLLYARFQERAAVRVDLKPREATLRRATRPREKVFVLAIVVVLLAMLSPLIALVVRSISFDGGYGTTQIANLFSNERGSYFHLSPLEDHMELPPVRLGHSGDLAGAGDHCQLFPIRLATTSEERSRRAIHAAVGGFGRDAGIRIHHRAGAAPAGHSRVLDHPGNRTQSGGVSIRYQKPVAGAERDEPQPERGCGYAWRGSCESVPVDRYPDHCTGAPGRRYVRLCRIDGRVRGLSASGPSRADDASGGDIPFPRLAGRREPGQGS